MTNYKIKDFAELLGVSVKTLQRWDREGTLKVNRTPTDRRYYTYNQYLQFKGIDTENDTRQIVIYARVSTRDQKDDLQDIVSILHVFSCRLYGLRKYKKQIERDEEIAKELQDGNQSN
ncbi:recombinase family protein [Blautia wexlerae]|uniref:recombinase family protein n=1 Tax=Blautia wexlerae TaxID=418240 RepID=UPI0034A5A6E4